MDMRTYALDFSGELISNHFSYCQAVDLKFRFRKMAIRRKVHESKCSPSYIDPADIRDNWLLVLVSISNVTYYYEWVMYLIVDCISSGDCFSELMMVSRNFLELICAAFTFCFSWWPCEPYFSGISITLKNLEGRLLVRLVNYQHLAIGTFDFHFNPIDVI